MAPQFTPGPWRAKKASQSSPNILDIEGDGNLLAFTSASCDQSPANARLIAAAPEMFEALGDILSAAEQINDATYGDEDWDELRKARSRSRAALAKARGEQ